MDTSIMCSISVQAVCKCKITYYTIHYSLYTKGSQKSHPFFLPVTIEYSYSLAFHSLALKNVYQLGSYPPIAWRRLFIFSSTCPCMALKEAIVNFFGGCPSPVLQDVHYRGPFALFWNFSFSPWILKSLKIRSFRFLSRLEIMGRNWLFM